MQRRHLAIALGLFIGATLPIAALALPANAQPPGATRPPRQAHPAPKSVNDWRPVVEGRLKNGLRYAILPRRANEPGLGLLMRVKGGFIAEQRPGERGLAHLIEHLAFASPTKAAPYQVYRFPNIGLPLTFSAPTAGTTTWEESNYFVSTRATKLADLDTLLSLFREVAGDMTLRADAVAEQRADVLREMGEKRYGNEIYAGYVAAFAPGSPTDVIDAQNSDDVPTASIDTIRALYHRLYRPERMMIVVVGNVDPAKATALIRQRFENWQGTGPAPVWPPIPGVKPDRISPLSYSARQDGRMVALTGVTFAIPAPAATRSLQIETTLMNMVFIRAVTDRLRLTQPDSQPGKTGAFIENGENGYGLILLWDNLAADHWRSGLATLKKTTCDLQTQGLSDAEWAAARKTVIGELEQRSAAMAGVPNVELAKDLSHALAAGRALVPPNELLRHARAWFPTVDAAAGNRWWREKWRAGVEHVRLETPELAQINDPQAEIRTLLDDAVGQNPGCKLR
ncbi:MAG: insulinase family protein [Sphingomonas sp.]|uniref:M16 family metallopeptidase n=1 Tax=Sphingomonas sp. TaxID=28214 RepID=UPI0025EC77FD|nr:insulinase family protein [Sphingomonas sp.]MBY0283509.1 insulinase family protein [Sphingomonas sp.]